MSRLERTRTKYRSASSQVIILVAAFLALPVLGHAQEAALSGTVTDTTGGVLPGVTVTATNEQTGNTFLGVTDDRGAYRIAARVGTYRLTAELSGFATVNRTGLELLVGQQAVVNLQMSPSALQESVTVTGEAPLVDTTKSDLGGNIDPRQLSELPVNGRNWTDLVLLAPGNRANAVTQSPIDRDRGAYHLNIDGQQVTDILTYGNIQPRFSRDAIAEFEFISNRFDATQGRSSGVQVNAITKSGTNTPSGSVASYFRDDRFNAADFIQKRVLPYSDQQASTTFGGPIVRDKIHFFSNYEYEREPSTTTFSSPYPKFNIPLTGTRWEHKATGRVDSQYSRQTRLMVRYALWRSLTPYHPTYTGGGTFHPSRAIRSNQDSDTFLATLTQVLGNRAVNEIKGGYASVRFTLQAYTRNPTSSDTYQRGFGTPLISLRGYAIGNNTNTPQFNDQEYYSIRDDLTYTFSKGGRHTLKTGGEYLYHHNTLYWCNFCNSNIDATAAAPPANLQDLFPVWNDATTWNIAALSPITRLVRQGFGNMNIISPRHVFGLWAQEDWVVSPRLTLNLGVRYDLLLGALGEGVELLPFVWADRHADKNNIGPRFGLTYSLNDRTVLRGGAGTYYADVANQQHHWVKAWAQQAQAETLNDGRPDFAANPYNGPVPTKEQIDRTYCSVAPGPSCVRRPINSQLINPYFQVPYSYQASIGMQRQVGNIMSVEADYAFTGGRHEVVSQNLNLGYNPATGANYPFTDISKRPYPDWGQVIMDFTEGRSNLHSLQTAFTKRISQGWQASATYTLSRLRDGTPVPLKLDVTPAASFPVAPDLGGEYTLAATDQRHRAVFNGLWEIGYGFQLSGLYFFGSGQRFATNYGADLRSTGQTTGRLRPNGTIMPRNNLVGKPIHRVDLRVQRRFRLGGRAGIDGILEVYNLFNHANYGSYVIQESNANYGKPSQNVNVAYRPRMLQLGFRASF